MLCESLSHSALLAFLYFLVFGATSTFKNSFCERPYNKKGGHYPPFFKILLLDWLFGQNQ
jgi:hypothetical protein